ncbi:HepT-like ribonuclease domain-containing protein [Microcystis aeruginosa]|nr:HepT-like ribonuclease domain-containing protein [Microcystis aeruginosa]
MLGEAARRIPETFQQKHTKIDWRGIIGLRNIISHQYDQVQP